MNQKDDVGRSSSREPFVAQCGRILTQFYDISGLNTTKLRPFLRQNRSWIATQSLSNYLQKSNVIIDYLMFILALSESSPDCDIKLEHIFAKATIYEICHLLDCQSKYDMSITDTKVCFSPRSSILCNDGVEDDVVHVPGGDGSRKSWFS